MPKAVFQDIYQQLHEEIADGTFPYESFLPSESELTARFECSRSSIRRALAQLAVEGYTQPLKGKGVRVIYNPKSKDFGAIDELGLQTFREAADRQGFTSSTRCVTFETIVANKELAYLTGFSEGSELLHAIRVRMADGRSVQTDESYYLASEVPGLTREHVEDSIYAYLENVLGMQIVISKRVITIEAASEADRELLDLTGEPGAVAVMRCNAFDNNGIMVEYTETRQIPGFFKLYVNSPRGKRTQ